jgi:hypothetical protein
MRQPTSTSNWKICNQPDLSRLAELETQSPNYLTKSASKEYILAAQATWLKLSLGMRVETESPAQSLCQIPLQKQN